MCTPGLEERIRCLTEADANDLDLKHWASCGGGRECSQCVFTEHKATFMSRFGSWLCSSGMNKTWHLTCKICAQVNMRCTFATGHVPLPENIKMSLFSNHANSKAHRDALALQHGQSAEELALSGAPPTQAFADLLRAIRANKANGNQGVVGVGKRSKVRRMKFCLAEAKRTEVKQFRHCYVQHQQHHEPPPPRTQ